MIHRARFWTAIAFLLAAVVADGGYTLYSQMDLADATGRAAQDFEAAYDIYDCEAAVDFVVDGAGWWITDVITSWTSGSWISSPTPGVLNVWFYADDGGRPAAASIAQFLGVSPGAVDGVEVTTPVDITLDPGHYWMSAQMPLDYGSWDQAFWTGRSVTSFEPAIWRNPGGGFGEGTGWVSIVDSHADLLFALEGEASVVPEPASLLTASLLAAGALGTRLRRRRPRS